MISSDFLISTLKSSHTLRKEDNAKSTPSTHHHAISTKDMNVDHANSNSDFTAPFSCPISTFPVSLSVDIRTPYCAIYF